METSRGDSVGAGWLRIGISWWLRYLQWTWDQAHTIYEQMGRVEPSTRPSTRPLASSQLVPSGPCPISKVISPFPIQSRLNGLFSSRFPKLIPQVHESYSSQHPHITVRSPDSTPTPQLGCTSYPITCRMRKDHCVSHWLLRLLDWRGRM